MPMLITFFFFWFMLGTPVDMAHMRTIVQKLNSPKWTQKSRSWVMQTSLVKFLADLIRLVRLGAFQIELIGLVRASFFGVFRLWTMNVTHTYQVGPTMPESYTKYHAKQLSWRLSRIKKMDGKEKCHAVLPIKQLNFWLSAKDQM